MSAYNLKPETLHIPMETARLTLRDFADDDALELARISQSPGYARWLGDMVFQTEEEARGWIHWTAGRMSAELPLRLAAIVRRSDDRLLGLVGVAPKNELNGEIEILYGLADEYAGCGYATEAGRAMMWWALECGGQDVLSALAQPGNIGSLRVLEKLGFVAGEMRMLAHDGAPHEFVYHRFYHTDTLPGPDWREDTVYIPEPMAAFFEARKQGYNEHMLSDGGLNAYERLLDVLPRTRRTRRALRVLDIGCGTGIEFAYIWQALPSAHITGIDVAQGMLDIARQAYPGREAQLTLMRASYLDADLGEARYDLIVACNTLHHLLPDSKRAVYASLCRALVPGGALIVDDFIVDELMARQYVRRFEVLSRLTGDVTLAREGGYHIDKPLTVAQECALMREAGFAAAECACADIKPRGSAAILRARKMARALVLMGSPRPRGNTAALLAPFMDELQTRGVTVDYAPMTHLTIGACDACWVCQSTEGVPGCPIDDDMQPLYARILAADLIVLGTPIYTWYCTTVMKSMLDRCYALSKYYGDHPLGSLLTGKRCAIVATHGYEREYAVGPFELGMRRYCEHAGMRYEGLLSVRDDEEHDKFSSEQSQALARAFARELFDM